MASAFANIGKIPELRRRILFTLALLAVYRIGIFVSVPGADRTVMSEFIQQQSGAFLGLAATRRDEAIALLMEKATYGAASNRARPKAVQALADIGKGQEKAKRELIVEKLVDLLRDPWDRVGWFAAQGLRTVKAPEAIGALQAYSHALSHQERVIVERIVKSLRQEDKVEGSALKKQVEELQEKVRKLEDQLQKLAAKVEPSKPETHEESKT